MVAAVLVVVVVVVVVVVIVVSGWQEKKPQLLGIGRWSPHPSLKRQRRVLAWHLQLYLHLHQKLPLRQS